MKRAALTRSFVRVRYLRGAATEEVVPLWQVVTTHTARHTRANLVMLGAGGDASPKEKAPGHADAYGHDALKRYGPALLAAWAAVLSTPQTDNTTAGTGPHAVRLAPAPKRAVVRLGDYTPPRLINS